MPFVFVCVSVCMNAKWNECNLKCTASWRRMQMNLFPMLALLYGQHGIPFVWHLFFPFAATVAHRFLLQFVLFYSIPFCLFFAEWWHRWMENMFRFINSRSQLKILFFWLVDFFFASSASSLSAVCVWPHSIGRFIIYSLSIDRTYTFICSGCSQFSGVFS